MMTIPLLYMWFLLTACRFSNSDMSNYSWTCLANSDLQTAEIGAV